MKVSFLIESINAVTIIPSGFCAPREPDTTFMDISGPVRELSYYDVRDEKKYYDQKYVFDREGFIIEN
jgi:hypothetical protein